MKSTMKIPIELEEIINTFMRFNFRPLNYETLAFVLNKDENTLKNLILGNLKLFEIRDDLSIKISVKKEVQRQFFMKTLM